MKKFRFDQILKIKEQLEEKKKVELKSQYELLHKYLNNRNEMINQIELTKKRMYTTLKDSFLPSEMSHYNRFLVSQKKNLEIQNQLIYYQNLKVEKKKEEVIESMKDRKKYERLKEKFLIRLKDEMNKNEQIELDRILSFKIYKKLGDDNG